MSGRDERSEPRQGQDGGRVADRGRPDRKLHGAWYTPDHLVALVVDAVAASLSASPAPQRPLRLVDPACGDGRFLVAAVERLRETGAEVEVVGVDVDPQAADTTRQALAASGVDHRVVCADALAVDWSTLGSFDVVIGNPPFLSQMAAATTRGGSSHRSGGPYADAAVEFVALAAEIVAFDGRVAFVLPQSLLSARDAAEVRARYDERATLGWSWWTGERVFDAQVLTCALLFEFGAPTASPGEWARVITDRRGVPDLPEVLHTDGTLGDRCRLNANFRDEYYGMVPAVGDHAVGPKLITSGLIDPGRCWWGNRSIRFAKQRFDTPRLDLAELDAKMSRWANDRLVPKVLIANQTKILEAVADPDGTMLPGVPVVAAYPSADAGSGAQRAWEIAAVLTSPLASAWAWHRSAGTGMSADAIRVGPVMLGALPWPAGDLADAVVALRDFDVRRCARAVHAAFGVIDDGALHSWWEAALDRIEARQPTNVTARSLGE